MKDEITNAAVKAAPPVAVSGWAFVTELTLNDWVAVATLIYIVLQAFFLVKDRIAKKGKRGKE